jgi:exodeoxyribonuclease VII large subunit
LEPKVNPYTLSDLNRQIKYVIALNFSEAIWVKAEINQISQKGGHFYVDLVEKNLEDDSIVAHARAQLWAGSFQKIKSRISQLENLLIQGQELSLKVLPKFSERYGLSLEIQDVDEFYTLGKLSDAREKTYQKLKSENLLDKNKQVPLKTVFQKIAILSSKSAAGYQDFIEHLHNNEFGYTFSTTLFQVNVQGTQMENSFVEAFQKIQKKTDSFDLIVIIRGGGSKLDLIGFDQYTICKLIAESSVPIITGIGHESDETLADILSYKKVKTPTAAAAFILSYNSEFEYEIMKTIEQIKSKTNKLIQSEKNQLSKINASISTIGYSIIKNSRKDLTHYYQNLVLITKNIFQKENAFLKNQDQKIKLLSPDFILSKGFTLTKNQEGKFITSTTQISDKEELTTIFHDGEIKSKIQ